MQSKKIIVELAVCFFLIISFVNEPAAQQKSGLTKEDVVEIVREYVKQNPAEIIKSVEEMQLKKMKEEMELASNLIKTKPKELEEDQDDPRAGSNSPKIKIVEFFDYNCGYCKRMLDVKKRILQENKEAQIIFKELPIMGDNSMLMARAALAVNLVDKSKYFAFHSELLNQAGQKDQKAIEEIVKKLGVDLNKFRTALNDPKVSAVIEKNIKLAQEVKLQGTPAYIVNGKLLPGAFSYEEFNTMFKSK